MYETSEEKSIFIEWLIQVISFTGIVFCASWLILKTELDYDNVSALTQIILIFVIWSLLTSLMSYGRQLGRFILYWPYFIWTICVTLLFFYLGGSGIYILYSSLFETQTMEGRDPTTFLIIVSSCFLFGGSIVAYSLFRYGVIRVWCLRRDLM